MTDVENDLMPRGDLLAKARGMAARWRGMASETKTSAFRDTWLGSALLIEDLIQYAEDRDKEIARLVREAALLRARVEDYEAALKSA